MDGHRFDELTRALAGARSRRTALRAALAGALAAVVGSGVVREAGAQTVVGGSRRLGEACASTSECSQSGGSVVCASNGLAEDGAKNCCRNSGGACGSDLQCCAGYYCINGMCGGSGSGASSGSGSSGSTSSGSGTKAPGAACAATAECSQAGGAIVCGDNGIATDGPLNCCRNEGGRCSDSVYSSDCCGGLYCREGACRGLPTDGTRSPGEACTETAQCNQVNEVTYCADNGLADDGPLNCCRYEGGGCSTDRGCCAGFLCIGGVCGGSGGSVAESGGDEAVSGGGSGYVAVGGACTYDEECSQDGAPAVCRDNGLPGDGAYNCCRYGGHACGADTHCCAGYVCLGGVCSGG